MRRLRVGQDVGFGWTLAAYRPASEGAQPHLRAERRMASGALANIVASSESDLLAKVASWSRDQASRKVPVEPVLESESEKGPVSA